ncbi:MAG: hypothetical protein ACXWQR_14200 [Ktedonobacterales bacterium]
MTDTWIELDFDSEDGLVIDYGYWLWPTWSYWIVPGTVEEL